MLKRVLALGLLLSFLLSGCMGIKRDEPVNAEKGENLLGIWFSYSEIDGMLRSESGFENQLEEAVEKCVSAGVNQVYIHIRSHCDSIFKSKFFPLRETAKNYEGDVFKTVLNTFHSKGIKVHAWINPYRISTATSSVDELTEESPAYKWLRDDDLGNDSNVCIYNGIYLNPAELEVRRLVIDGIREVMENYDVDGIHFDDYFYPTIDPEFDSQSYEAYLSKTKEPLNLHDWRRENVNSLISGSYSAIKFINEKADFSISPMASVSKNYDELYADVGAWIKGDYVDTIIPQLYFGFEYPDEKYRFENLLEEWEKLLSLNKNINLLIGLANYKIGTELQPDCDEWQYGEDIIARQAELCYKSDNAQGVVLFSYSSVFSEKTLNKSQLKKLITLKEKY